MGAVRIKASTSQRSQASPQDTSRSQENVGLEKIVCNNPWNEEPTPWPINRMLPMTCNRNIGSF